MSVSADDLRSAADFLESREASATRPDLVAAAKFLRQSADVKDELAAAIAEPPADRDWPDLKPQQGDVGDACESCQ